MTKLLDSMKRVKSRLNPSLDIYGVLLTMSDNRTNAFAQVSPMKIRRYFGKIVFETSIPYSKAIEAPSFGRPITGYDPTGKVPSHILIPSRKRK